MKRTVYTAAFLVCTLTLTSIFACAKAAQPVALESAEAPAQVVTPTDRVSTERAAAPVERELDGDPQTRMVIREAHVDLRAEHPAAVADDVIRLTESAGGFVVQADRSGVGDDVTRIDVTLRVPERQFEPTLAQLRGLGTPLREQITGQDVTEEFVDLQARLRAKQKLEARLTEILGQATSVKETLEVENELARVRTEIEQIEGRSQYLSDRVKMSTIHISATAPWQPPADDPESFTSHMASAFDTAGEAFVNVVGGIVVVGGALAPLGILFALLGVGVMIIARVARGRRAA